ncbi:MAG TPA: hypothetical protein VFU41_03635 [Gemmatimonadales bacterium]|nr:hypothetical protein [Gemmatimonadales bacterium]
MRPSWRHSLVAAALLAALPQGNYRVSYRLRVLERAGPATRPLATSVVAGPLGTDVRLSLRTETAEVRGLLGLLPEPDTVTLSGIFFGRRLAGNSRRGLPLWEEDSYRRSARLPWGGTVRLHPLGTGSRGGRGGRGGRRDLWVEITVTREFAAGETRPSEEVTVLDSSLAFGAEAVAQPRRVMVRLALVRGDTASSTRALDLVPDTPGRRVSFTLGAATSAFDVGLVRPDPPQSGRDSALALGADVICLRVTVPDAPAPAGVRCGRLDNIARRMALAAGDTLVATFAWPSAR